MSTSAANKPRVIGIVGLCIIGGILNIIGGLGLVAAVNAAREIVSEAQEYSWVGPLAYAVIALGALQILAAILILMYKRIGLIIGGAIYLIGLLLIALQILTGSAALSITTIISILIDLAVLYYIYVYLTREPEKSFFK